MVKFINFFKGMILSSDLTFKATVGTIRFKSEKANKNGEFFTVFTVFRNSIDNKEVTNKVSRYIKGIRNKHLVIIIANTREHIEKNQNILVSLTEKNFNSISYNSKYFNYVIEASGIEAIEEITIEGFGRYLETNFKGIGKKTVPKFINAMKEVGVDESNILPTFKSEILKDNDIIKKHIGETLFEKIKSQLNTQKENEENNIYLTENEKIFCSRYAIGYNFLLRLKKQYIRSLRNQAEDIKNVNILTNLRKTPYFLAIDDKIKGFGFKSIDDKVKNILGNDFSLDYSFKMQRFLGYLQYVLIKSEEQGHLYLTYYDIYKAFLEYNKKEEDLSMHFDIDEDLFFFEERVKIFISHLNTIEGFNPYFINDNLVSRKSNYFMEFYTAKKLLEINKQKIDLDLNFITNKLSELEKSKGIQLSEEQREAVLTAIQSPVSIITGGPGTGKTTISQMLIGLLKILKKEIKVLAPTGTASKRISSVIGMEAMTIHRGLEFKGYFTRNEKNPLSEDVIIIDESSMIDSKLAQKLINASMHSQLIFIGDVNQLPSVGAGDFLRDIISSGCFSVSNLTKIFRQAEGNPIISFAYKVDNGSPLKDFFQWFTTREDNHAKFSILSKTSYKRMINDEENKDWLNNMLLDTQKIGLREYILNKNLMDVQILVTNNRSNGIINKYLQEKINGDEDFIYDTIFKVNDKVIQTKNNYKLEIFNGTIGVIERYDARKELLYINIGDDIVEIDRQTAKKEMQLCYSMTIHKSQGQEFRTVIMLLNDFMLNTRELIYTGATRAKENLKVITNPMLLQTGISRSNKSGSKNFRNTRLVEFLSELSEEN